MELKNVLEIGGALGALYIMWQILKVVLDYRKNRPQPIASNGIGTEIVKILNQQTVLLERVVQVNVDHKAISIANGSKLSKIDSNLILAMDRQQETRKILDELKKQPTHRRK